MLAVCVVHVQSLYFSSFHSAAGGGFTFRRGVLHDLVKLHEFNDTGVCVDSLALIFDKINLVAVVLSLVITHTLHLNFTKRSVML